MPHVNDAPDFKRGIRASYRERTSETILSEKDGMQNSTTKTMSILLKPGENSSMSAHKD